MNQLTTRTTAVFAAAMIAMIILGFAAVMTVSAQTEPERPTDLTATAIDHDTVSLTWSHPDPASVDHYLILSRTVGASTGLSQVGTATTTSFEHDGLEPESTYIYRVKAVNSQGEEGQRSARAEATTPAEETPAPPQRSDGEGQGNIARASHDVLVSNTGQTSGGSTETGNHAGSQKRHAQKFTTGSNPTGYTVDEVRIYVGTAGDNAVPVITINSGGGTNPGTVLHTMTNPATLTSGAVTTFTAPAGTTLDADTSYFIVMVNSNTANNALARYQVGQTSANGEDNSGLSDWDIDDAGRIGTPGWGTTAVGVGYRIQIRGTANESSDATLSDLELEGAGGETITLSPEFAQGTTAYTAAVANRIDTVTLSATKNDANATVVITSDDDNATPGEAELDLSVGANALTVTVTAEDAYALAYTITATRATAPPAPTDCPTDTDWCATLVLGYIPISSAQFTTEQFGYFSDSNFGDLSSATFSHGGISYTVSTIFRVKATRVSDSVVQTDNITFTVSPELPDGVVLQLDTRTFTVDADSEGTSTGQEQWDTKADPPVWTAGQHVTVSLKLPSETLLVSNLDVDGEGNDTTARIAQRFNTGENPGGYTLTTVEVSYADSQGDTFAAMVCTVVGADQPTSTCTELTPPSTFTAGLITFTAPAATELTASTKYTLVLTPETGKTLTYNATAYDAEDSDSLPNWNIAGEYRYESGSTWEQQPESEALQIRLKGQLVTSTLPELSFQPINITVDEDGSQAALAVELSQTSTDTVTVDYATSDITAEAGDDYTETSGTLTFAPGETVMAIIVPILDDAIYEPTERFDVTLSNPAGATLPTFPGAQINIAEDESPPTASIANVTVGEGAGTLTLTLNLSHESSRRTAYRTQTSDVGGTATGGTDYENFLSSGEAFITVPAGDTQASLDITITDDTDPESSETITIHWENDPTGGKGDATPATIDFTGTITDNDSGVQLTIQDASADETSSSIAFRIDSSETLTQDVTFKYSTSIGASDSAEADDFDPESAVSHTLSAGSAAGFIDIDLNDDDLYEGDETFTVTISNPVNAGIADATATGTIIDDETQPTLEVLPASATEGEDIIFLVDLTGPLTEEDVTFNYATSRQSDDTSEAIDFTRTTGTETIAAGNSAAIITVPTSDDGTNHTNSLYEGDETFTFTIFNPTVAAILHATAKGTILDDERIPIAAVLDSTHIASENAGTIPTFIDFEIGPRNERPSQISLSISGTATQGDDYSITTTINVPRNINQFSAPLTIIDDLRYELTETAVVTLVSASDNIQVDPNFSTRTLTIVDNDDPPVLAFAELLVPVDEDDGHAVLTVNKTGLTDVTATVDYETRQGPEPTAAIAGQDYVTTSGTLTFQPNETSKTISVPIIDNNVYEATSKRFEVVLQNHPHALLPPSSDTAVVSIFSEDPVPTASMANVTANERAGTMTVTLKLSHPSSQDIQYIVYDSSVTGTATRDEDYVDFIPGAQAYITVSAGQPSGHFDITLIDDGLEEEDESILIRWVRREPSTVNPQYLDFTGTITDPPVCDALGNLENTIVVTNLTGEITQPGQSKFHRIRLDPYRSYMIEAIGHNGEDMLGVEEHPNLTLSNPDIPAIWNAKATSKWSTYGDRNDGDQPKNVIRRFLDSSYRTYKVEVNSGTGGTGTYQLKVRVNNICRLDENDNAHYQWAGGPLGYPAGSDLPAGTGGRQVLLTGTDWGNNNITRPEMHHVLGDNWDSNRDEDWIGVDLEDGELYTVRLRTKNNLPERLQATGLKVLGIRDENGNEISGTASAGAAGKKVFLTDWTAPSTGRFHIAVGSEGNDRTGIYWLSIIKDATN